MLFAVMVGYFPVASVWPKGCPLYFYLLHFSFCLARALVWVIGKLVFGACLEFGAWNLVLQSYQFHMGF
jgi:hypothetical protein